MINKITKALVLLTIVSLVVLWFPQTAQAAIPDRLIIGGNFTLTSGETLNEELLIIGGLVTLENGSTLNGDILIVGGSLNVSGQVNGAIVVAGGSLDLTSSAIVSGDITTAGTSLHRDPGAVIAGNVTTEQDGPFIVTPPGVHIPQVNMAIDPFFNFIGFFLRVLLWALLAMLLALFLPDQINRVSHAAMTKPFIAGGLGLFTVIVLPLVLVIMALTILLIPVSLIGVLLIIVAWFFGVVAMGTELGHRFAGIFKSQWHPALAAGLGTFFLILVINGMEALIPCLGWLPKGVVGMLGLGAVLLTRFGTQPYPPDEHTSPPLNTASAEIPN
jgi:hypothetical protein